MSSRPGKPQPQGPGRTRKRSGKRELQDVLFGLAADLVGVLSARLGVGIQPGKLPPPMHECAKCHARFWMPVQNFAFCPVCGTRFETGLGTRKIHIHMSRDEALAFLAQHSSASAAALRAVREVRLRAYRQAAAKLHPDKPGGSHEQFCKLQEAMEVLR
jgi:hypothetical protein